MAQTGHRPWPAPERPWSVAMSWHDLAFIHWPVLASALLPLLPPRLDLDTFEGRAWIGIVPFRMTGVRLRGLPALRWYSDFPELNVRTYVRAEDKPGVWFFSLDAANALAVAVARVTFHLPYYRATMQCQARNEEILYTNCRAHRAAPPAVFRARYGPTGPVRVSSSGSIEHWLMERYCLYAFRKGELYRGEIHHPPWPLQPAQADLVANTMAEAAGISLPSERPLVHFARRLDVLAWSVESCRLGAAGSLC